jgi:hypothetical protein
MNNQKIKIEMLENRILDLEDTLKFLKQIISSQNDTIKSFTETFALIQQKNNQEPVKELEYEILPVNNQDQDQDQVQDQVQVPVKKQVLKASSIFRRRTVI